MYNILVQSETMGNMYLKLMYLLLLSINMIIGNSISILEFKIEIELLIHKNKKIKSHDLV